MIFSIRDSGVVAAEAGLDLSSEVVKRFDAANAKAPATAPAPAAAPPATTPRSSFAVGFRVLGFSVIGRVLRFRFQVRFGLEPEPNRQP